VPTVRAECCSVSLSFDVAFAVPAVPQIGNDLIGVVSVMLFTVGAAHATCSKQQYELFLSTGHSNRN
jgi:hypothetical protein